MGFYGNMTNSVKTNMTFDRKYSSRKNMDDMAASDGVYTGRYVLVEYGLDWTSSVVSDTYNNTDVNKIIKFYKYANNNNAIYKESSCQIRYEGAEEGQVFYIGGKRSGSRTEACDELWIYKNNKYNLITDKMLDRTTDANYVTNFNIDKEVYGAGRGYDSTVWTKTYGTDGVPRYVMIAELNAIIPTFTITADAPSDKPNPPYFDELNTNVHYNMHVGTPWGYKIGTIEFNEAGFDSKKRVIVENPNDDISVKNVFSNPKNSYNGEEKEDIKELSIYLPSIGNMVAKGWDVIHGENRKDDPATSLQGRLNFFTNKDDKGIKEDEIPVQSNEGYLVGATFKEENLNDPDNRLWIESIVDSTKKEITVKHTFKEGEDTYTFANKNTGSKLEEGQVAGINHTDDNVLKLYTPLVDGMGHVIARNIETITLPYGYKTFTIGEQSTGVEELTANTFEVVADNTQDSMTITSANKWIRLAGEEDKIQVAHAISTQAPITVGNETLSPKFGDSFNIPRFTTDEAGHITAASNQTITLQAGSYTPADNVSESTEVITSIGFDAATGNITSTKADSSTLKLTSYSAGTDTTDVANGDTYNNAFAKLQNQINGLDYGESSTTKIVTAINQTDGLISVTRGDAGTLVLTGYALDANNNNNITATDSINVAFSKLQQQILDEEKARADAIAGLDAEITTESYEVISAIIETDGKIRASSKKKVGELTLSDYSILSSGSAISPSDTLNTALGKLEYKLDSEIDRVSKLDYTDPDSVNTTFVSKVTQEDGKINVSRSNAGTLLLTDYNIGTSGEKIASTDSINTAFAKLQTQINNIIGSEEIATNFDNIKKISDWLSANDSDANKVIDDIATLNGDDTTSGSVAYQIKTAIDGLDSEKVASEGKYISGIHIVDGKISTIDQTELPIADWDATEGLSVIRNKPTDLVKENDIVDVVRISTEFDYETKEVINEETGESTTETTKITIDDLIKVILGLQDRIKELEENYSEIINPDNQPEEEIPETTE